MGWSQDCCQHLQQGRLPCAIGADNAERLTRQHFKTYSLKDGAALELAPESLSLDDRPRHLIIPGR